MVYTASSVALAALELLVHLEAPPLLESYVQVPASFEGELCRAIDMSNLPPDWAESPVPESTKDIGDEWHTSEASPVLAVPSVLVPTESVYLLNPQHPDSGHIRIGAPANFEFDPRLL